MQLQQRQIGFRYLRCLSYSRICGPSGRLNVTSTRKPIVFFEQRAEAIVRERINAMVIAAGHRLIVDQHIQNRFFGGLHNANEKRVHEIIGNCLHVMGDLIWVCDVRVRS
jgi:hypothetical protein